jgi:hypothetical protein
MASEIKIGVVESNFDVLEQGKLYVVIDDIDPNKGIEVQYSSPYLAGNKGGFIAIPEVGVPVIVCKPSEQSQWFYLATVVESVARYMGQTGNKSQDNQDWIPEGHKNYVFAGHPQQLLLKTPKGNALRLSDAGNLDSNNVKAELESSLGKKVSLNDSPDIDAIIIDDSKGNFIKIYSSDGQMFIAANRSIILSSERSNIDIVCENGKEINILNHSTGSQRSSDTDTTPGNINLTSDWAGINLTTNSKSGAIVIKSLGDSGNITLEANNITVHAKGRLNMLGDSSINIESVGNVTIKGARVDLNPLV